MLVIEYKFSEYLHFLSSGFLLELSYIPTRESVIGTGDFDDTEKSRTTVYNQKQ